jgi:anti-sigma factor RsiW
MNHEPDQLAAAYLDGMRARPRRRYEQHLLDCDACWREVSLARLGRGLAERLTEVAPPGTREAIRTSVTAAATEARPGADRRHRRRLVLATGLVGVLLALGGGLAARRSWQTNTVETTTSGSTVALAVASFRADRLPGTAVPAQQPPDLSALGLHLAGASTGTLNGTPVTVFAYRGHAGSRLNLYRGTRPIPETDQAQELDGVEKAWRTEIGGITVICGPEDHTELLLGSDPRLVHAAGTLLNIV